MKKLTVTIEGPPGSGKTTASLLIARALMDAGLGVNNEDFDVVNNAAMPELQRARLDALVAADVIVDIVSVQHRSMPEHVASWHPRRRGSRVFVAVTGEGDVYCQEPVTTTMMHECDFVAMIDPDDDNCEVVVHKDRFSVFAPKTYLTPEHAMDVAMAYLALRTGRFSPMRAADVTAWHDVIDSCRIMATSQRRQALAQALSVLVVDSERPDHDEVG